jgi:hypothetical protein
MSARMLVFAAAMAVAAINDACAQLIAADSIFAALDSRYVWRHYDRGSGLTARGGMELGLAGYPKDPNSQNKLVITPTGWLPLADRDSRRPGDQGELELRYGRCVFACARLPWFERWTLEGAARGYWLPHASGERYSEELELDLAGLLEIQKIGSQQLGARLFPCLSVAYDMRRYDATYARACLGTQVGPVMGFAIALDGGLTASDFPSADGTDRDFRYHGADAALSINREFSVAGFRTVSLRLIWTGDFADEDIGARLGVLSLRGKWY